jgi:hypothetical protein
VELFGHMITATMVSAMSATKRSGSRFIVSQSGTRFEDLTVRGKTVDRNVRPDTRIALPGLGYVVLDQVSRRVTSSSAALIVDAIHVVVTEPNSFGVATNSNILVAHAMSGLNGQVDGTLGGESYGSWISRSKTVNSSPAIKALMPCLGTNGALLVDSAAQLNKAGPLASGSDRNTADGTVGPRSAVGVLTSTVHNVNILNGIVTASAVNAVARVAKQGRVINLSDEGSGFDGLAILGVPAGPSSVPVDTMVPIPGVGELYLHRVIRKGRSIEVRMVELVVTHANRYGLPVGSDFRIGVAIASAS